jgi:hypothetical protein
MATDRHFEVPVEARNWVVLKPIGFWISNLDDDRFPPPQELVSEYDTQTARMITDYLDAGTLIDAYFGFSWCRFLCGDGFGSSELSDGEWLWPEGLSHYVRYHNVRLPDSFLAKVQVSRSTGRVEIPANHGRLPDDLIESIQQGKNGFHFNDPDQLSIIDYEYWTNWSTKHRSNHLAAKLQEARKVADAEPWWKRKRTGLCPLLQSVLAE